MRVSLERLLVCFGETEGKLNTKIANLSKKGLSEKIIKGCDIVRIYGNDSLHAGEIDFSNQDTKEVVNKLFWLINFIVDELITKPREIDEMFINAPENKKIGIQERDGKNV